MIHRGNKAGSGMDLFNAVAGHINDPAVVQYGVEDGNGFVPCHVDFIEDPQPAVVGNLPDRPRPEGDFIVPEGILTD